MEKPLTRTEISEMLRPRPNGESGQFAVLTLDALEATLRGIAAGEIPSGHAIHAAATSMGYLVAGCTEQAARAARQAVVPCALPATSRQASAAELLSGVAQLRTLLNKVCK
jgi:hypothetical protein